MENYKYEIFLFSSFAIDEKIISKIYLPILGKDAVFLYQFLRNEYDNNKNSLFEKNNNHKQILFSNDIDWNKFISLRKSLEAVKLISTYINKESETFTYVLNPPLTFEQFYNDEKMFTILRNRTSKQQLEEIKYTFSNFVQRANMFEISESIDYLLTETEKQDFFMFNFDRLYKLLISEFHMNFELTYELKLEIDNLFSNRILNFNEIYELLKLCVIDTTSGYSISIKAFNDKVSELKNEKQEAELSKKIIINRNFEIFSTNRDLDDFKNIIYDYKKYKTENYITSALKENVTVEIKKLIYLLRVEYNFNDQMINVIIDFVIFKNNGSIQKNYILKIAKTILAKAINTVEGVIEHFRKCIMKKIDLNQMITNKLKNKDQNQIVVNANNFDNLNDIEKKLISSWR